MSIALPNRSRAVFWVATIVIGSAIAATVLFANDKRHLRHLTEYYHIAWLDGWLIVRPPAIEKPVVAVRPNLRAALAVRTQISLPAHGFDAILPGFQSSFVRTWKISGEDLCAKLSDAGIPVGTWKQSGFDAGTFECSYETRDGEGVNAASLFIIVRGAARGELSNVRLKAILPDTAAGRDYREEFVRAIALLINDSHWPDFQAALESIGRLEDVTLTGFGVKLSFSHEFENARRFNFILDLERTTPEQRRTSNYFDTLKWLDGPTTRREGSHQHR